MANPYGRAGKPKPNEEVTVADTAPPEAESGFDVTQTPDFQMALAAMTVDIHDKVMADVKAMLASPAAVAATPAGSADSDIQRLARAIAMSNAELADQGTGRKRVSPEIVEGRRQSRDKMEKLLSDVDKLPTNERPRYKLRAKGYFGDQLVEPFQRLPGGRIVPTEVIFLSVPNLALVPLNASAKAIYDAYIGSISGGENSINGIPVPDPGAVKPAWMTKNGVVIAGVPSASSQKYGMAPEVEPLEVDLMRRPVPQVGDGASVVSVTEVYDNDDPRRDKINVLGTLAAPAVRGSIPTRTKAA